MKKSVLLAISIMLMITSAFIANAKIYQWTDKDGKKHFGDKPPAEEKVVVLSEQQINARGSSYTKEPSSLVEGDIYRNRLSDTVVMYTTSSCGYCAKARKHFTAHNIKYVEKNIDKSTRYKHEFKQIKGKGVPLIFMGEYQMSGFSVAGFTRKYEQFMKNASVNS
ncbi:glutaredoxin domain-containing protein [Colwellia asteriadis]|uniref:Glutaredoxin domain-containing protein n=1 Tax=Colwellia asteriadis TaxID=517723 RepID=A0ABN1LAG3_9GAMM